MTKEAAPLKYPPDKKLAKLFARTVAIATAFPGVEVGTAYGTPALKSSGKFMARLRTEAEGGLALKCDFNERDMLLMAAPEVFYLTDHYLNYPVVLIRLDKVDRDALKGLIEQAWRTTAKPKLVKDFDKAAKSKS